ncbi:uncharacterized protein LOC126176452 [Schistocerca cancellata]|uniref:uncharacterized protein LOC126176452 n=1 Tax=Schistocerca cancellata TaxID=274614 RepID=UPI0021187322|nr:uncharacterized protein LOC126176452 [Schistocerca cancellata]
MDKCTSENFDTGYSDHLLQLLTILVNHISTSIENVIHKRIYSAKNIECFQYLISEQSWREVYDTSNTNKKMEHFLNIFKHNFDIAFPQRKVISKSTDRFRNWIKSGIRVSCKRKRELFLQSKTNSSPEFINYLKKYKLVLKRIIKEAKIKENDKYIMKSSNKTKSMWKAVQDLTGKKTTHKNIVISHDGKNVTDPREVANSFNSYYATVAGKLVKEKFGNPPNTTWKELSSIEINNISMLLSPVSPTELLNTINSLKSKYSTGIDDIPDYIIKITARQILSPLLDICNSCLSCGVFPQQLKMAKENLKWNTHITALNSKLAKMSYVVRILCNSTSAETVGAVYFARYEVLTEKCKCMLKV